MLDKQLSEEVVDKALTRLRSGKSEGLDRQGAFEKELSLLETKVQRIIRAIADGHPHEAS